MKKRLNWVFPVLLLEGPNINVKSMENIKPISKDMLDEICENGRKFQLKYIKDFQFISVFLNEVWRFKRFLNKFYCIS